MKPLPWRNPTHTGRRRLCLSTCCRKSTPFRTGWKASGSFSVDPRPENARAADWLLDNDYQISRAIREIRQDMPAAFYKRLHVIADLGLPRAFRLAHAILATSRFQLSVPVLVEFLGAYQEIVPLTTAELWALPSMLRLASLEILASGFQALDESLSPPFRVSRLVTHSQPEDPASRVSQAITAIIAVREIEVARRCRSDQHYRGAFVHGSSRDLRADGFRNA